MVLAPVVRGKKGFHRDTFEELSGQGGSAPASTARSSTSATC
jgi:hypothetical protein